MISYIFDIGFGSIGFVRSQVCLGQSFAESWVIFWGKLALLRPPKMFPASVDQGLEQEMKTKTEGGVGCGSDGERKAESRNQKPRNRDIGT